MKRAGIAELKDRLSHYLRFVRRGESVLIYDRDRAVARIEPVRGEVAALDEDWTVGLEMVGILRGPTASLPEGWLERRRPERADVVHALLEERAEGP